MPSQGGCFTNHPGVVDFMGHSYLFYHNQALPGGGSYHRSVCVEEFTYNEDGTFPELNMTKEGPEPIRALNPYDQVEAETFSWGTDRSASTRQQPVRERRRQLLNFVWIPKMAQ